ncbi:MAG: hypothetical protein HC899_38615 [Leptolyngbyaceae cyanobacterium SM1_4_3]|nr:hypothetical protein [Leptolyngbyaceae cyanobacterium SM1_4_3]
MMRCQRRRAIGLRRSSQKARDAASGVGVDRWMRVLYPSPYPPIALSTHPLMDSQSAANFFTLEAASNQLAGK